MIAFDTQQEKFATQLVHCLEAKTSGIVWSVEVSQEGYEFLITIVASFPRIHLDGVQLVYRYSFRRPVSERTFYRMNVNAEAEYIASQCWSIIYARFIGDTVGSYD